MVIFVFQNDEFVFKMMGFDDSAHFGASPDNGFTRSEFLKFDEVRKGHTADERCDFTLFVAKNDGLCTETEGFDSNKRWVFLLLYWKTFGFCRWRKDSKLQALAQIGPSEKWRTEHRKKFETRTRSSVQTQLLQRRGNSA